MEWFTVIIWLRKRRIQNDRRKVFSFFFHCQTFAERASWTLAVKRIKCYASFRKNANRFNWNRKINGITNLISDILIRDKQTQCFQFDWHTFPFVLPFYCTDYVIKVFENRWEFELTYIKMHVNVNKHLNIVTHTHPMGHNFVFCSKMCIFIELLDRKKKNIEVVKSLWFKALSKKKLFLFSFCKH